MVYFSKKNNLLSEGPTLARTIASLFIGKMCVFDTSNKSETPKWVVRFPEKTLEKDGNR